MSALAREIHDNVDEIVQRWHDAWRDDRQPHHDLSDAALKDSLPDQLRVIADQLASGNQAERPAMMWRDSPHRLDPENRITQEVAIEEVVQEFELAVRIVRDWIDERGIHVTFAEYSYFYQAMFELAAESVRRYAKREADLVSNARAEYLAGVMHQLRTPLNALSMTVELVASQPERAPRIADVERLRRNVGRLKTLVEGVLRVERYEPADLPVHPVDVEPARLLDDMMSDHEREASRKGLRFEAHVDRSLRMRTDPDLLADAVGNLVHNAVKYTARGHVLIDVEERGDVVVFRISDTGPGIDAPTRDTLFDQIQPGRGGGAGLGLRIARHAAQALGGGIELDTAPGRGSTFCVTVQREVEPREGGAQTR
ncbi:sensor histidine kinase [Sandaracinus amylolyticus]|uniref:histidine kinase n=1 Tax=Sandaracinus amylolyticus TaxID=927083 RepID=A0A0F6SDS3_9BACT|nr:HAMP domain-containing sensor histidine kinase [Sandaracinus amylolyticus]AKF03944.1 histidine kinase [Sandaracinus amylolyticus]